MLARRSCVDTGERLCSSGAALCGMQAGQLPAAPRTQTAGGAREGLLRLPLAGQAGLAVGPRFLHQLLVIVVRDEGQGAAGGQQHGRGGQQARHAAPCQERLLLGLARHRGAHHGRAAGAAAGRTGAAGRKGLRHSAHGLHPSAAHQKGAASQRDVSAARPIVGSDHGLPMEQGDGRCTGRLHLPAPPCTAPQHTLSLAWLKAVGRCRGSGKEYKARWCDALGAQPRRACCAPGCALSCRLLTADHQEHPVSSDDNYQLWVEAAQHSRGELMAGRGPAPAPVSGVTFCQLAGGMSSHLPP